MLTQEQIDGLEIGDVVYECIEGALYIWNVSSVSGGLCPVRLTSRLDGGTLVGRDPTNDSLLVDYYFLTKAEARKGRLQFCLDRIDKCAAEISKATLEVRKFTAELEEVAK